MYNEEMVPNGTRIRDIKFDIGKEYVISRSIETDNQFGYGVYLYKVQKEGGVVFGLWRSEFEIVEDKKVYESIKEETKMVNSVIKAFKHVGQKDFNHIASAADIFGFSYTAKKVDEDECGNEYWDVMIHTEFDIPEILKK